MRFYSKSPLVLLSLICSILFFTSCSKDSDLLSEYVLLDPETVVEENSGSDGTDGSGEEEGGEPTGSPTNRNGVNLILNGTFENSDKWVLRNGSTATGGVLTVIANGNIGSDFPNWSAQYPDISPQSYYETRRYRLTFTARQVSGNGILQVGQRFARVFEEQVTSNFVTYTFEFNGDRSPGGHDLVFGGRGVEDVFEIKDVILEDAGATTDPNVPGLPGNVTFYTDFEAATYPYEQWGANGVNPTEDHQWEVDNDLPRTTDHASSALKSGRSGTGRAVWLGGYNNGPSRNELARDNALTFNEHWMGFSVYIENELQDARIIMQNRNLAPGGSSTVNTISLRQERDVPNTLYFSLPTNLASVDQTRESLGTWNGAGTNTNRVDFSYTSQTWIDIVIHYKGAFGAAYTGPDTSELARKLGFDPRSDGFIEIWVDGKKIVDHVGTTTYRYEKRGGEVTGTITPKIGPYWSASNSPQGDYYFDEYKIWIGPDGTYEDVSPLGLSSDGN